MAETYCGKSCAACVQREELNCPGCKAGPGRPFGSECSLAECCRSKGHESCETCGFQRSCGTLRSREHQIDYRRKKTEAQQREQERLAQRAPVLGKWLWIMFWLIVPAVFAAVMGNDGLKVDPTVHMAGRILNNICSASYGAILLKLASEEDRYRRAGICALISAAAGLLLIAFSEPDWSLLITLPIAVVALVGEYNEYHAHAAVLAGVDNELAQKWTRLWKWYIGLMVGGLGCILLMLIVPRLGLVLLLSGGVAMMIVGTLKYVYLYRTARVFRLYSDNVKAT